MFRNRIIEPELLDHAPAEEAELNLVDLVRINENFGGHSVIRKTFEAVVSNRQEDFSVLDVGSASGDTAGVIRRQYPNASVTCLDYNQTNISAAPQPKVIADAFHLPFAPGSFDFVLSSLFLHHFTDVQVTHLLKESFRVSRRALLACDLERHVLPYVFLPATRFLFRWRAITLHDGPISVRAAFRAGELRALSQAAGISKASVQVHRPAFRLSLIAPKALSNGTPCEGPVGTRR